MKKPINFSELTYAKLINRYVLHGSEGNVSMSYCLQLRENHLSGYCGMHTTVSAQSFLNTDLRPRASEAIEVWSALGSLLFKGPHSSLSKVLQVWA